MIWRLVGTALLGTLIGYGPLVGLLLISPDVGRLGILPLLASIGALLGLVLLWRGQAGGRPPGILITLSVLLGVCLSFSTSFILIGMSNDYNKPTGPVEIVLGVVSAGLLLGVVGSIYAACRRRAL